MPQELGPDFDLLRILRFGSIPVVWTSPDARATLDSYVNLYLREEIRAEALVRNLPGFLRFLPVAALMHGQTLSISSLARDAMTPRTTIEGYIGILRDTLLADTLPAFSAKLRVRERQHPKLFWTDPGVVRAAKRQPGPVSAEETGALLEGWVLTVLRAHAEVGELYEDIAYWAPLSGGTEVDFLLRRGHEFLAVEVKAQTVFSTGLLSGLRAISDLKGVARRILLYLGTRKLRTDDGIEVWPVPDFLNALATSGLWP